MPLSVITHCSGAVTILDREPGTGGLQVFVSLVHFHETNHDTVVTPVTGGAEPVLASQFLRTRLDAITVG